MANERTADEPLAASIGDQLGEKVATGERTEAERQAAAADEERTERHKAKDREEVAKHLGGDATPEGWRARRGAAREGGRRAAWLREWRTVLALPIALAGGVAAGLLAGPRRKGVPWLVPLAGWIVYRRAAARAG